jgi:hypothetical protein
MNETTRKLLFEVGNVGDNILDTIRNYQGSITNSQSVSDALLATYEQELTDAFNTPKTPDSGADDGKRVIPKASLADVIPDLSANRVPVDLASVWIGKRIERKTAYPYNPETLAL